MSGDAPFTYQWYKGATLLSNGGSVSGATTSALSLTGVALSDADTYSVVVSDAIPSSVTNFATLTVIDPVVISSNPISIGANYTDNVTLSASATGGGTVTYKWKKNGVNMTDGGNISGTSTSTLSLASVSYLTVRAAFPGR